MSNYMSPPPKMNKTSSMNSLRKTLGLKKSDNVVPFQSRFPSIRITFRFRNSQWFRRVRWSLRRSLHHSEDPERRRWRRITTLSSTASFMDTGECSIRRVSLEIRSAPGFRSVVLTRFQDASVLVFDKKSNVKAPPKLGKSKTYSMFDLIK